MKVPVSRVDYLAPLQQKPEPPVYVLRAGLAAVAVSVVGMLVIPLLGPSKSCQPDQPDAIHMRVGEELSFGGMTIRRMR